MTAYSGLWNGEYGVNHSLLVNETPLLKKVSKLMRRRGLAVRKELMLTLNGAAAGSTALATRTRVQATQNLSANAQGGVRAIETVDLVNRATVSGDKTAIDNMLQEQFAPTSYPTDASGNGGGGKVGV